jgi:filamentous hemagglutinin family protein
MNRIFRTLWSVATQSWQAVPETAKTAGKTSVKSSATGVVASFALSWTLTGTANAQAPPAINQLPTGGAVARGNATISQTATAQAAAMTVNQSSQRAVLNWSTFNLGSSASINFVQPNAQAVTLNRVNDSNPSQIFGRITANGQVFLTNASGVYFAPSASVDVGALTATTHRITDDNFMSGNYVFERNGATGKVINEGGLNAALRGYIALLAPEVQNTGVVIARAGTVALAAGEMITLNVQDSGSLAGITTTPSAIASLIENKLAVQTPDGQIILSATALNKLQAGVIKNSGSLEANSLVSKGGKIYLEADDITLSSTSRIETLGATGGGSVLVGGDWQGHGDMRQATHVTMQKGATIDASATDTGDGGKVVLWSDIHNTDSITRVNGTIKAEAGPQGGQGGKIETSGHRVDITDASISAQAPQGNAGEWLIDPYDYTIGSTEASALASALGSASVTVTTANDVSAQGSNGVNTSNGDITINSPITWSAPTKLTLNASRNININAAITANGTTSSAGVALLYNQANTGGNYNFGLTTSGTGSGLTASFSGAINFASTAASFSTQNYTDAVKPFTLISTLSTTSAIFCATPTACDASNATNFALTKNIDATTFVNGATKFNNVRALGTSSASYTGTLEGLGHTISKLSLGNAGASYVGLFNTTSSNSAVRDLRLSDVTITGSTYIGSLVGYASTIAVANLVMDSSTTNTITGTSSNVGGLIGNASGSLNNIYVLNTNVTGTSNTGGVAGQNYATANNVHKTGNVTSTSNNVGGVFGYNSSIISNIDSVGDVSGAYNVGGLIGNASTSTVTNAFARGSVTGTTYSVGGLFGNYDGGTLSNVSAGGSGATVRGPYYVGGLIGSATSTTTVTDTYFSGTSVTATSTTGGDSRVGGLIGNNLGTVNLTNANVSDVTITGAGNYVGGLTGYSATAVNLTNAYAKNTTLSSGGGFVGGLAGNMGTAGNTNGGSMLNAYFEGTITLTGAAATKINYGGLTGYMVPGSWLSNSYYNIDTSTIDGNKVVSPGGLFNAQYTAWAAPGVSPASRVPLTIGNYLTLDGADNTYVIDTTLRASDFTNMLAFVESGTPVTAGVSVANGYSFKLGADLNMSTAGMPYLPYFGATALKGNGYAVNNFSFNRPTSSIGFLGVVQDSTLTDLKVNSVAYAGQTTNAVNARDYVGTVVGSLYKGTLSGATATLSANVNALSYTGGLAGYVGQSVMYSDNSRPAPSTSSSVTGTSKTGGLVGWMDAVAANTLDSTLAVSGTTQVGGLAGYLKSDYTTTNPNVTSQSATGLTASGNVTGTGTGLGGLIGEVTGTSTAAIYTLNNASASGNVSNTGNNAQNIGGLIGTLTGGASYNNLQSSGSVTQTSIYNFYPNIGGLIGSATGSSQSTITNSSSSSVVSSTAYYTGGLIGSASGINLTNSYATGNVTGTSYAVGGLIGYAIGGTNNTNVYASGNVSGSYQVGGLIGNANVNVTNAYASGNVTGTTLGQSNTGGLIGLLSGSTLLDSRYITGSVSGTNAVGGVVGASASGSFIKGVFTAQPVTGSQDYVGGLVGKLGGTLTTSSNATPLAYGVLNPYSSSAVVGRNDVGGLVGRADAAAVISNAYFTGSVLADYNYGGVLGYLTPGAQVTNAHYNIDSITLTGFTPSSPTVRVSTPGLITLGGLFNDITTGQTQGQYTNWFNAGALNGLSSGSAYNATNYFGAATSGVYTLSSIQNLRDYLGFADQTSLSFKLGNTIDLTSAAGLYIPYVSGIFDPNGKSITHASLSQFTSNLGFIGHLQGTTNTLTTTSLTVTDSTVLGKTNVGLAVGSTYHRPLTTPYTTGTVTGSDVTYAVDPTDYIASSSNSVFGKSNVGGVIGYAVGTNSTSAVLTGAALGTSSTSATVNGGSDSGGLIGRLSYGTVTNTTSTGAVTGSGSNTGGLIGYAEGSSSTLIYNVSHTTGLVLGVGNVGGLIGQSSANVGTGTSGYNTYATSKVEGSASNVGGLIGYTNGGSVTNTTASGNVSGPSDAATATNIGGLIGKSSTALSASNYTGLTVKGSAYVGGLVGYNTSTITNVSVGTSTSVLGSDSFTGGLAGYNSSTITSSSSAAVVTGLLNTGGLVGNNAGGAISSSSSTAVVTGTTNVGGLVGNNAGSITSSSANNALTGTYVDASGNTLYYGVKGSAQVGGLIGLSTYNSGSAISSSTSNTTVIGLGSDTGGFIGQLQYGTISGSGASGTVYGINETGGFVGQILNSSSINTSYANSNVINTANTTSPATATTNALSSKTGGFVGWFNTSSGSITSSRAAGSVKGSYNVGGFAGYLSNTASGTGAITLSYATGMVTGTADSAGGFAGYAASTFTGSVSDFYAMGAVKGNTNVGGLVGYADRGTFSYGFSTGYVASTSNATSIGGSFGGLNVATLTTSPSITYRVNRNNLYYDTTTSNRSTDPAGGGGTGAATSLTTAVLQGTLPTNFSSTNWGTGTGLYPYLKVFYPNAPQAISGIATLSNGALAVRAQVGMYNNGTLLNGGTASTGINGYYYELVGASALRSDSSLTLATNTKLGATLTLDGQTNVVGMVYSDAQTLTNNNVSLADANPMVSLKMGLTRERTGAATAVALNTDLDTTFGSANRAVFASSLPTRSSLELTATAASFDLNTPLSYSDNGVSNAGNITVTGAGSNTNVTLSAGTITSTKAQTYNAALTLGADEILTGTNIITTSTLAGGGKNLSIAATATPGTGNLLTGGTITNVAKLSVTGTATLGANVTTSDTQTYSSDVVMKTNASNLSSVTAPATGANITISGNLSTSQTAHAVSVQTGSGTLTVNGSVGAGSGITAFTASGANLSLQAVDASQSVTLSPSVAGSVGPISGSTTTLTMAGTGTLTLTTDNSYGGNTTISSGSLQLGTNGQLNSGDYSANIAISSGAQLQDSSTLNQTFRGVISGAGNVRKDTSSASALTLAGNNSYSGTTTIAAGSVVPAHANALGATSGATVIQSGGVLDVSNQTLGAEPITLSGGTVSAITGDGSVSGPITLSTNSFLTAASTKQLTASGTITTGSNGLVLAGAGNFELSNTANAIGTLASDSGIGTLNLNNHSALHIGSVSAGGQTYSGLSSTGHIVLQNTAALTLDTSVSSSGGEIDLVATRVINNAGATALQTSAGKNWRVWSTNTTPFETSANGGDVVDDLPANYIQYNATFGSTALQGTGNGLLYTLAPQISASLTGVISKTYDGTTHVSVGASNYNVSGLIHGDQLSAVLPTQSDFTDNGTGTSIAGVGSGKTVVVTGMSLLGINAGRTVYGYRLSTANVQGTGGEVVPAPLLLTVSKTYDASNQFDTSLGYVLTGMVNNESAPTITGGSATTSSANAATYTSFATSSFTLNNPNYSLPLSQVNATIHKAPIGIEMTANYSGSTTVTPSSVNVYGLVGNQTLVPTSVLLHDKNVSANGSNYVVDLLAGTGTALASNYTFVPAYNATPNTGTTNTITLSPVSLTVTANSVSQTYNGSSFSGGTVSYTGLLGADTGASLGGTLSYTGTSQGARHAGSYVITPGGQTSSNYTLSFVDGTLTINPKTVSLSAVKTYDGTTSLTGSQVSISTGVGTEVLSYTNATASDAHVATANKYIQSIQLANGTAGAGVTVGLATDYQLPALDAANASVSITPARLIPTLSNTNVSKTYDSTSSAPVGFTPSYTFSGLVAGDTSATVNHTGMAYDNAHVLDATGITVSGLSLGSITGNHNSATSDYALDTNQKFVTAAITPKTVSLSASKIYDGTTSLTGSQVSISTGVGTEVLSYTNATANDAHVATANKYIQSIQLANGTAGAGVSAGLATDYQLPALNATNASVSISPATLTPTLSNTNVSKDYDGTLDAPSGFTASYTFSGLVAGDTAATLVPTSSTYNDAHVLNAHTLTLSGLSISAVSGTRSSLPSDYVLDATTKTVAATVTPRAVGLSASKTYDGTTNLSGGQVTVSTGVTGEDLSYTLGSANDAHVATPNKFIQTITLGDGVAGLVSDYKLPTLDATHAPVTIQPAILTASLTNTGVTKTYDGTLDAPAGLVPSYNVSGFVAGDTAATLSHDNVTYNSADVASANKVSVTGLKVNTITGNKNSAATDYVLDASSKDVMASITAKDLRVIANNDAVFFADSDTPGYKGVSYVGLVNGQTAASLGFTPSITNSVSLAEHSIPNVYVGALTPSGISSTNYHAIYEAGDFTVLGAQKLLVKANNVTTTYGSNATLGIESAAYKYTDSNNVIQTIPLTVSVTGTNSFRVADQWGGYATFTLAPDTGGITTPSGNIKVGAYDLSATSLVIGVNPRFNQLFVTGTDTVTPKTLTVTASGINKVYNSNTTATVNLSSDKLGIDDIALSYTSANFANKNVGTNKPVSVSGIALGGTDAANYSLANTTDTTSANITAAPLTVTATGINKVYDGSTAASVNLSSNQIAGDLLVLQQTSSTFADKLAQNNKNISVTGITLSGVDADNYALQNTTASTTAHITPRPLSATGIASSSSIYGASLSPGIISFSNVVGNDSVTATTSVNTSTLSSSGHPIVGTYTQSAGTVLSGSDANNYTFVGYTTPTANYSIDKKTLTATGIATASTTYGSALAPGMVTLTQIVGSDQVQASASVNTSTLSQANLPVAGSYTQTASSVLSGNDAANYNFAGYTTPTANYTIDQKLLTVTGIAAASSVYGASLTPGQVTLSQIEAGDAVSATASVNTSTLSGAQKPVVGDYTQSVNALLRGDDAANYRLPSFTTNTANYSVVALDLSNYTHIDAAQSVYGSAVNAGAVHILNILNGDTVSASNTATVNINNFSSSGNAAAGSYTQSVAAGLTGADAGNYTFSGHTTPTANYTIQKLALAGSLSAGRSTYGDALQLGSVSLSNVVNGDDVSPDMVDVHTNGRLSGSGNLKAGTHINAQFVGSTLYGSDANNYSFAGLQSNYVVDPLALAVTGITASNKVYNASNNATLVGPATVSAFTDDVVSVSGTGVGTFADKNVGNGKSVTVTGFTLTGADAANYTVVQPSGVTANITKADLAITGITANNKVYDTTVAATLSGTAGVTPLGSDVVSPSGTGVGTFADKNAGNAKSVTVTGFTLTGTDAANYNVVQPSGITANITKADLAITGVTANNKVYDTTVAATLSGTAGVTPMGSDVVSPSGTGVGTFADKNAGNAKSVTVTGFTLTGTDATNYNVVQPSGVTANITKADLAITGITANNKVYDATVAATLSGAATVSGLGSDVVSASGLGSATFADKNVGNGKSVTVTGFTLTGADATNYNVVQPSGVTANITKADLAITGVTANNKVYDTTVAATLSGTAGVTPMGSDVVSPSGTGVGTFADKNAGNGKSVTVTGFTLTGADATNYNVVQPSGLSADITPAALTISGLTADHKVYDGNTNATVNSTQAVKTGLLTGDVVNITATGNFADKNAATGKTVTISSSYSGADVGNYNITDQATTLADITPKPLGLSIPGASRVYDASTTITPSGPVTLSGIVGADQVNLGAGQVTGYVDKNVGTNKTVTYNGLALSGVDANNYSLPSNPTSNASITPAPLTISGITVADKIYDANTTAMVNSLNAVQAGLLGNDVVNMAVTGSFVDKNAGVAKTVNLSASYSGADVGNYNITDQATATASITPANLQITGVTANNKVYDATRTATLSGAATISAIGSDTVSVSGTGVGTFADKNVGNGKSVTVTGFTLTGTDATNYNVVQPSGITANITKADLAITGVTANNKVYDATVAATLSGTAGVTPLGSDVVSPSGTGVGTFADKNVGEGKSVTVTGFTLTGADATNYNVVQPSGITANITKADLAITGVTANNKVYDATVAATLSGAATVSGLGSDVVSASGVGTATFADKNAGNGKSVTVTGFTLTGADAANYNAVQPVGLTADITKAPLTITADSVEKLFGNVNPPLTVSLTGFVGGETLATSGVTGSGSATTTAATNSAPGLISIQAGVGTLAASNYAFTNLVDGTLTIRPISSLGNDQVTDLIGSQLSRLSALQIGSFTATQLQVFSTDQVRTLSLTQVSGLTAKQVASLSDAQLKALSSTQVEALDSVQLTLLTPAQISLLTGRGNASLKFSQMLTLSPTQVSAISPTQIGRMSAAEIASFSDTQLQALTTEQLAAIEPGKFSAFSPEQIMALSIAQVQNLTPEQLSTFTPAQIASLSAAELAYFDARQLAAIGIYPKNTIEVAIPVMMEVANMTPLQIRAISPEQLNALPREQIANLKPAQLQALTTSQLSQLTPEQANNLSPSQLSVMSSRQVDALPGAPQVQSAPRSGVLAITILQGTQAQTTTTGVAFEQEADTISLRTAAPPAVPPMTDKLVFSDKLVTFLVATPSGEMVEFQGSLVNKRMVIVAPSVAAKQIARTEMNLVLAAAVTSLGQENRVMLANLDGVLFDLR